MRAIPVASQPPPPTMTPMAPLCPQDPVNVHRPPVDKILKCGAEEFRGETKDDLAKVDN